MNSDRVLSLLLSAFSGAIMGAAITGVSVWAAFGGAIGGMR